MLYINSIVFFPGNDIFTYESIISYDWYAFWPNLETQKMEPKDVIDLRENTLDQCRMRLIDHFENITL
jgi:hypothetical protein